MLPRTRLHASYACPWLVYGMSWSNAPNEKLLAVTSFTQEYANQLEILQLHDHTNTHDDVDMDVQNDSHHPHAMQPRAFVEHPYPATKVLWTTENNSSKLATTADYLRIWRVHEDTIQCAATLSKYQAGENCSPLTSADWSTADTHILGTSAVDTSICIWDLNKWKRPKQEIVAHDAEVYDMTFSNCTNIFASVGGDGTLRIFDLRNLKSCSIIYESADVCPLIRLTWNKLDQNYIAAMMSEGPSVLVFDVRKMGTPATEYSQQTTQPGNINAIAWSSTIPHHICAAGETTGAFTFDVQRQDRTPVWSYNGCGNINHLEWSRQHPGLLAMAIDQSVHVVNAQ
ncbi:hypothetical protein AeMF1_005644 [Aphanomyces euteiches]|nr:hypothetical protein AeMF1_005644 [Aphanomyces euteiches]KAH9197412.1 hypothetical protein AeNC1_000624 [Aphanomyces euteiches]